MKEKYLDMWYGDSPRDADKIDIFFSDFPYLTWKYLLNNFCRPPHSDLPVKTEPAVLVGCLQFRRPPAVSAWTEARNALSGFPERSAAANQYLCPQSVWPVNRKICCRDENEEAIRKTTAENKEPPKCTAEKTEDCGGEMRNW